jgi:glycosyltransferase involved in cell wall biosynthesis
MTVEDFLHARGAEFDAIYITRYYVAEATIPKLRQVAPHTPVILNNADLHFLRELRTALAQDDTDKIALARTVRKSELRAMQMADVVLSYNEVEHSVIQSHTDGAVRVMKCPWVVDLPDVVPPRDTRTGLSFLGSYQHPPNAEGVLWFVREVMPVLEKAGPRISLSIYGAGMTDEIKALKSRAVDPVGFIDDVADAYDRHCIFIAPLLSGAGIKGKVLAALAHGIPCVLSPVAAEGIGLRHGYDCMIAATPADWANAIRALQDDPALWQRLSDNARAYVRESFSFERGREEMRAAFEAVDLFHSRP